MWHMLAAFIAGFAMALAGWFGHGPSSSALPLPGINTRVQAGTNTSASTSPTPARASTAPDSVAKDSSAVAQTTALPAGSAWETALPLGDGDYNTSGPKTGYIYLCHVAAGGGGAQGKASWISGSIWYPAEKVAVEGSVSWPNAAYAMSVSGSTRTITSNGLPTDHDTGIFPIQKSDPAYQYDANPNSIEAQAYSFSLPIAPTMLATPDCIYGQVGIMNDGVPLFDGFDAAYRDAVAHETQDAWEGHPDQGGVYHDHGFETGAVKDSVSTVVGYAFDGYPITGSALPNGKYLHTADLDECHGLTSAITLDGAQVTMYHYVLTQDFPYSVSCFRGKSYEPKPGGTANTTQSATDASGLPPAPPQQAVAACTGKSVNAGCTVGQKTGSCTTIGASFACKPD